MTQEVRLVSAVEVEEVRDAPMVSLGPNGLFVDGERADATVDFLVIRRLDGAPAR